MHIVFFENVSLKNKFFLSILAVIMIISVIIALLSRWILLSSLMDELEHRGIAIAQSVADRGSGFVLDNDKAGLTALLFDARLLGERRDLVSYIFVDGPDNEILAHSLITAFPDSVRKAHILPAGMDKSSVKEVYVNDEPALDIAVPVMEGIYRVATVHVGLNQRHIDRLVGQLRITFLGFITLVVTIIFWISHRISSYITQPVTKLIEMSDEISRGNLNFRLDLGKQYEELMSEHGTRERCPAYHNSDLPCWHVDKTMGPVTPGSPAIKKPAYCRECVIRHKQIGDEVLQLADSFVYMVRSIKLYRNRLRESEVKYRSLFDAGPDPIFVVDSDSMEILDVNPRAEDVYRYPLEELLGMPFSDLETEENMASLTHFAEGQDAHGSSVFFPKAIHYRKGRQAFFVNMHACGVSYGDRDAIILSTTDITDIVEKDAQLIQASKMTTLGEMSAGIAHELNQPLNAIKMGSDFLGMLVTEGGDVPREQLEQVTTEMSAQVDRATEIINTLRAFGRKSSMTPERLDINDPIHAVLKIAKRQIALQGITLDLDLTEGLLPIQAHDNRLQQVFFNLVSNARDAIDMWSDPDESQPKERAIFIRTFHENGQVVITFRDTGCGMDDSHAEKIFEPFYTTKATGQGMGLGLAISYGIVKDYGGKITVDSKIGAGTTFKLVFPPAADN